MKLKKQSRKRKRIVAVILGMTVLVASPLFCMAGTMNSNEKLVYSAAQKTFIYEGESYVASGEYLSQLSSYLCQDDVDLTAEEAMAAIAQMNSSVAEGVENGYIVPVGSSNDGNDSESNDGSGEDNPGDADNPGEEPDDSNTGDDAPGDNTDSDSTQNSNPGSKEDASQDGSSEDDGEKEDNNTSAEAVSKQEALIDQQRVDESILDKRPDKADESTAAFYFDRESGTILAADSEDSKGTDKAEAVSFGSICFDKEYIFMKYAVPAGFVLAAAAWVILAVGGCLRFQKEKHGAHTRRKRCRQAGQLLIGLALGLGVAVLLVPLVLYTNVLKNDRIVSDLNSSGFYSSAYLELMDEVHEMMTEAGCLKNTCDGALTYEKFCYDSKNYLQMDLAGKENNATLDRVKKDITEAVDRIVYFTDKDKEKLADAVVECYRTQVNSGIGGAFYEAGQYFTEHCTVYLIAAAVLAALCLAGMFGTRQPLKKAIGSIGTGLVLAGAVCVAAAVYFIVKDVYAGYYIRPDYLYMFFYTHMTAGMRQYLIPGIAALAVGVFGLLQKRER